MTTANIITSFDLKVVEKSKKYSSKLYFQVTKLIIIYKEIIGS